MWNNTWLVVIMLIQSDESRILIGRCHSRILHILIGQRQRRLCQGCDTMSHSKISIVNRSFLFQEEQKRFFSLIILWLLLNSLCKKNTNPQERGRSLRFLKLSSINRSKWRIIYPRIRSYHFIWYVKTDKIFSVMFL